MTLKLTRDPVVSRVPIATSDLHDVVDTPMPYAIEVSHITKRYAELVLDDVSFSVPFGTICGLVGRNGAGKSTLLRTVLGLTPADSGHATVLGQPYQRLDCPAGVIGVVLDGSGVAPHDTARNHLTRVARYLGITRSRVDEVLEQVQLTDAATKRVGKYSLGMQQRLSLASAMLAGPDILVLDEPANGLDPEGLRWLRSALRSFADDGGAVLVSSHQLLDLQQIADRIVILEHRVVFDGTMDELGIDVHDVGALEEKFFSLISAPTADFRRSGIARKDNGHA